MCVQQLIFRKEVDGPFPAETPEVGAFSLCAGPLDALRVSGPFFRRHGIAAGIKGLAKLLTRCRMYYCICRKNAVVSDGWITLGLSSHYDIEPGAAVVGPVWTDPTSRCEGLAAFALKMGMNAMFARGCRVFYIDTSEKNVEMQRVIEKCGFGAPGRKMTRVEWERS